MGPRSRIVVGGQLSFVYMRSLCNSGLRGLMLSLGVLRHVRKMGSSSEHVQVKGSGLIASRSCMHGLSKTTHL